MSLADAGVAAVLASKSMGSGDDECSTDSDIPSLRSPTVRSDSSEAVDEWIGALTQTLCGTSTLIMQALLHLKGTALAKWQFSVHRQRWLVMLQACSRLVCVRSCLRVWSRWAEAHSQSSIRIQRLIEQALRVRTASLFARWAMKHRWALLFESCSAAEPSPPPSPTAAVDSSDEDEANHGGDSIHQTVHAYMHILQLRMVVIAVRSDSGGMQDGM